ncbi:MAG: enoyl-CoA hydratase/isomerase family protein [Deltaproteobacteria bacterium]|nr:enoyl-CoA hydratase/isomerase family protein [Deltaproteobacteria bacterium]
MQQSSAVRFISNNGIAEVTICREEALNALNREVLDSLETILEGLERAFRHGQDTGMYANIRAVVIRGAGKAFVAGADIKLMQNASGVELERFIEHGQGIMRQIEMLPLPVIALVDGFAIGGGMELALACDLIIATERAKFGQAEVNLGIIPGFGGTQRLTRRAGVGAAKRLIYSGETISGEEAYRLGIAEFFVSSDRAEEKLKELTDTLLSRGPIAIACAKRAIEVGESGGKVYGLESEREQFLVSFNSKDAAEGLAAFAEKRKPKFEGK